LGIGATLSGVGGLRSAGRAGKAYKGRPATGLVPLLFIEDGFVALRVANLTQIVLPFLAGRWWAHYSESNRWLTGSAIAPLGTALVLLAVPLGA
jgi:hypothetical protein